MESRLFLPRLGDLIEFCTERNKPVFLGFLSEKETADAERFLKNRCRFSFWGGYDEAVRTYLCIKPDWCDEVEYPIIPVTFTYRVQDKLLHRDFLGALTGLGIAREKIGDILVEDGRAVAFLSAEISDFVLSEITLVGRVGVTVKKNFDFPLPQLGTKSEFSVTVASDRLDCIVSALCGTSRNKAQQMITESLVSVNSALCEKFTKSLIAGDKISIRKKGLFNIVSIGNVSKKGRIILKYEKYL